MAKRDSFIDYVLHDLLGDVEGITARGMFSGYGLYQHGTIFGLIIEGVLYLKVGERTQAAYEAAGSQPFRYDRRNGTTVAMSYWEVPEAVLSDRSTLARWVADAVAMSRSAKVARSRKKSAK